MIAAALVLSSAIPPSLDARMAIRDASRVIARRGDAIWPTMSRTRLRVDLVEATREVVFCDKSMREFASIGDDPTTGCSMQQRSRELPTDVSATSDLDGHPVIEMGSPELLGDTRAAWTVRLLHETFHLYQHAHPLYRRAVAAVRRGLEVEDGSDSWPLDYPFPYTNPTVANAFSGMERAALVFLAARSPEAVCRAVADYVAARGRARAAVGAIPWLYCEFQVGQEGVARWTELQLAAAAGRSDPAIAAFAANRRAGLATSLRAMDAQGLSKWRRESFYVLGAVEADMLDRLRPGWRRTYLRSPFSLGEQLIKVSGSPRRYADP